MGAIRVRNHSDIVFPDPGPERAQFFEVEQTGVDCRECRFHGPLTLMLVWTTSESDGSVKRHSTQHCGNCGKQTRGGLDDLPAGTTLKGKGKR